MKAVLIIAALVAGTVWYGFVLSILWAWFAVPLHVPGIGIAEGIGLSLIMRMFTYDSSKQQDQEGQLPHAIIVGFVLPLIALIMGFIVHLFM